MISIERYGVAEVISSKDSVENLKYFCSMWNVSYEKSRVNVDIYTNEDDKYYAVIV